MSPLFKDPKSKKRRNSISQEAKIQEMRKKVAHWLVHDGFTITSPFVTDMLATLIEKSMRIDKLHICEEYAAFGGQEVSSDSIRNKLTYYINKNYSRIYECTSEKYDCKIEPHFSGNSMFIRQLGALYRDFYDTDLDTDSQ